MYVRGETVKVMSGNKHSFHNAKNYHEENSTYQMAVIRFSTDEEGEAGKNHCLERGIIPSWHVSQPPQMYIVYRSICELQGRRRIERPGRLEHDQVHFKSQTIHIQEN